MNEEIPQPLAKSLLVAVALTVGGLVFFLLAFETRQTTERRDVGFFSTDYRAFTVQSERLKDLSPIVLGAFVVIAVIAAMAYLILGAVVVRACNRIWRWAYLGKSFEWDEGTKIALGAIWPLALVISVILCVFLGTIHRVF